MPRFVSLTFFAALSICLVTQAAHSQNPEMKFRSSRFSDRDLLRLGEPLQRMAKVAAGLTRQKSQPDTLRILAIRVDFQEDTNSLTTGNGKFQFTSSEDLSIDPPPHNLAYFEDQLLALSNYYKTVSHGKLILAGDVYPKDPQSSYTVSEQMSSYVPTRSEEELDRRLSELFQEGFKLADSSENIDFSQYDSFILFHAGVGSDFALDFDPTPQDVPSVFLDFNLLKKNLGGNEPGYQGIAVNGGNSFIKDGIILPETQTQEGFEIALLGTMTIMFGNQLGLPLLFNPDTGRSGIGVFGLMDQGSGNFLGLLPAEPCAWSKIFLGWETPIEISNGADLPISAPRSGNQNKIYKIPINEKEYFLLENRNRDINNDGIAVGRDAAGTRVEFVWDEQGQRLLTESPVGVITRVDEYDFGLPIRFDETGRNVLPGPGILIWHIDERVIEANFASNRVNANPELRGVDLEEADGAQDIGQIYGFLDAGAGSENGITEDAWWASNPIITQFLRPDRPVAFDPTTMPSSNSNTGAISHITINDFSEPDSIMSFSVHNEVSASGFPQFAGTAPDLLGSPKIADLNNDGTKEIILNSESRILVWQANGTKLIENQDSGQIQSINGDIETLPLAVFAEPPGESLFPLAVASFNNINVVVAVTNQTIAAYLPEDTDANGRADSLFVFSGPSEFSTAPMVIESPPGFSVVAGTKMGEIIRVDSDANSQIFTNISTAGIAGLALFPSNRIAFASVSGEIGVIESDGTLVWRNSTNVAISKPPVIGDLDQNGDFDVVAISDAGEIYVYDEQGGIFQGFPKITNLGLPSPLVIGDVDGNRYPDIIFIANNRIYAYSRVGTLVDHFPIKINTPGVESSEMIASSPILADLDGDGIPEIIVGSNENQLIAFHANGDLAAGFPLSTGGTITATAAISDLENDGDADIAVASEDGFLYLWDLPNDYDPGTIPWASLFKDPRNTNANPEVFQQEPPSGRLMPTNLVYNYPNPTEGDKTTIRYRLNFPAVVRIKIYDLAGDFVDELFGPGIAQADNEVDWQLNNIESGVYLARIEAQAGAQTDVTIIKIAVVK